MIMARNNKKDVYEQHFGEVNEEAVITDIESTSKNVTISDIEMTGSESNTPTTFPTRVMQFPKIPANSNKDVVYKQHYGNVNKKAIISGGSFQGDLNISGIKMTGKTTVNKGQVNFESRAQDETGRNEKLNP